MFPNLPHYLIKQAIAKKWNILSKHLWCTIKEFIEGISFLLDSTFLQYNNKFYKQVEGAPMGFCTSPWFADLTMEALETNALEKLKSGSVLTDKSYFNDSNTPPNNNTIIFFKRFVDDLLLIVHKEKIDEISNIFNNQCPKLKFTIEQETNSKINFLDIEIYTKMKQNLTGIKNLHSQADI